MLTLERLKEILEENFGEPYLEEGAVRVEIEEDEEFGKILLLGIGGRDIELTEEGLIVGSGAFIG